MTPRFGTRLAQEGNRLHYLADRVGIRGLLSDVDTYHLDQVSPLLMRQLELMPTSDELNPHHQHIVTLYAKGLTCKVDTLSGCGHTYLTVYPAPEAENQLSRIVFRYNLVFSPRHFSTFISAYQENLQYENVTCITRAGGQFSPVSC